MTRKYKKKVKPYTEETVKIALKEIEEGASIVSTDKKYHIGYGSLQKKYSKYVKGKTPSPDKRVNIICKHIIVTMSF